MDPLQKTPSGDSLPELKGLAQKLDSDPRMRKAVAAALKAMKLQTKK